MFCTNCAIVACKLCALSQDHKDHTVYEVSDCRQKIGISFNDNFINPAIKSMETLQTQLGMVETWQQELKTEHEKNSTELMNDFKTAQDELNMQHSSSQSELDASFKVTSNSLTIQIKELNNDMEVII
jgi:hypothetical protein